MAIATSVEAPLNPVPPPPARRLEDGGLVPRLRRAVARGIEDSGLERLPLRWRFRLVVMALTVPFLGYILWTAAQQVAVEKQRAHQQTRADALLLATRFEDHIEQIDRLMGTAAQSIGADVSNVASIDGLVQSMRSFVPKSVDNIGVWALDGSSISALDRRPTTRAINVSDRNYFKAAIATRAFTFEGPIVSRTTGAFILQFARPIFDTSNRVVGVLTMAMRPDELIATLDPGRSVPSTALVTFVDRDGVVLSRSRNAAEWIGRKVPFFDVLAEIFESRGGMHEEIGFDGTRRLAGFATVGRWPWAVTVGEPLENIVGPASDRLLRTLGVGLAILAFAFVGAGRVAAWTTRPLLQLAADTERLSDGDLSYRSGVTAGGEIATLAAHFNRMAVALQNRDLALAMSKDRLRAITDNIPEQVTYVDMEQRYRFVNARVGPFQNMAPEHMLGKTVREVRGEAVYQSLLPLLSRAMAGEPQSGEKSVSIDGRQAHYFVNYVPDIDESGAVHGVYAFAQDITTRKTAELLLIESERRLAMITDNLPALIAYVDTQRIFRFANRAYEEWFERPLDQIVGQPFDRLMAPGIAAQYDEYFLRGMQGETCECEVKVPIGNRPPRWFRCVFIPDGDESTGVVRGVYGMIHDVTTAKTAEERLTRLAQFDTLTGIANRHQFNETLARVLVGPDADARPLALMFLDIDHFKQVNDRHGHGFGDLLLKEFAERLVESVGRTDAVARLAGDEFVVLLEGIHSDEEPQFIARKIIAAVGKPFVLEGHRLSVTTSVGIAVRSHVAEAASLLMKRADEALYEAKRGGRNTFRLAG